MGFINKLFGGLFAFLGAIFGGLSKLLGIGKKSEYFLEADASKEVKEKPAKTPAPAKASAKAPAAAKTAKAAPAPAASQNGKVAAPAPAVAAAKPVAPAEPLPQTFAPNFLISSGSNSRRRPGPSLNPFLDMAKQIKPQG